MKRSKTYKLLDEAWVPSELSREPCFEPLFLPRRVALVLDAWSVDSTINSTSSSDTSAWPGGKVPVRGDEFGYRKLKLGGVLGTVSDGPTVFGGSISCTDVSASRLDSGGGSWALLGSGFPVPDASFPDRVFFNQSEERAFNMIRKCSLLFLTSSVPQS
jgi:hypothetical protein